MKSQLEQNGLQNKKILIATVAADGHFKPLTGLAKYLSDIGCEVKWYTSGIYKNKLDSMGIVNYPFKFAKDINGETLNEIFPERNAFQTAGEKVNFDMINVFIEPGPDQLADIIEIRKDFSFDAVIVDNMFPALPYLSARLDVPVVAIGIIPLSEDDEELGPYGPGFYPPSTHEEMMRMVEVRAMFREEVYKESTDRLITLLDAHGIAHKGVNFFDIMTKAPDRYLQIGTPSFEYTRSKPGANIEFIGALLPYSDPRKEEKWTDERLKKYEKVLLVTQGTIEGDVSKLIIPTLETFKNSEYLVIVTTGGFETEKLANDYPYDNVIIKDFIPFDQVMPHADVYITNGGYGGTLMAIGHHLPMVCAGLHEGKAEICARVGYFKYGIDLGTERPNHTQIKEAVERVITDPQFKTNVIALAGEMEHYDAPAICTSILSELVSASKVS
ncbi:glycosyltransferase [Mucilaginibacter conchicola]|uniref:Glycosyltransferase n=1 Tax=Mucilaginibacter conchicola TaxID=2303333 RepID=A0A372NNT3_9SPHI|nr:nucleotide disphospho-sugar-binding domain-containing protein [Mucilaginibacter conchicola]RFZ90267.1 glycosyltransferase [Mucilaginibacter conchicola]